MPMEGLIKEADQAMYEAKHAGRNAYRLFKGFSRV
jgi:PleD family two-component response regulator